MERKMATIRKIDAIEAIEGADLIHAVKIGGWTVVAQKEMGYKVGDLVVYCEIDSFIPTAIAPFLTPAGHFPKHYNGVEGERLKTKKLKGVVSQGLLLPLSVLTMVVSELQEGLDVSFPLGIQKWEPPAEKMPDNCKGTFPSFIPKTDQERIQNLTKQIDQWNAEGTLFEVTEKLDGSSMTVFVHGEDNGVCSRNLELKQDSEGTFWTTAVAADLHNKIRSTGRNLALQGELLGPGIQGNKYQLTDFAFFVYDVFDIDSQSYLLPWERRNLCKYLEIKHVPVIAELVRINEDVPTLLKQAEFKSNLNNKTEAEGKVYKAANSDASFKVISNKWLMKHE